MGTSKESGIAALRAGDAELAVAHLLQALRQDPRDPAVFGYLGIAYEQVGVRDRSLDCLRYAVQLQPQSAPLWYNLGLALERAGKHAEAAGSFQQALRRDPGHAAAVAALERARSAAAEAREAAAAAVETPQPQPQPAPQPQLEPEPVGEPAVEPPPAVQWEAEPEPVSAVDAQLEPAAVEAPPAEPIAAAVRTAAEAAEHLEPEPAPEEAPAAAAAPPADPDAAPVWTPAPPAAAEQTEVPAEPTAVDEAAAAPEPETAQPAPRTAPPAVPVPAYAAAAPYAAHAPAPAPAAPARPAWRFRPRMVLLVVGIVAAAAVWAYAVFATMINWGATQQAMPVDVPPARVKEQPPSLSDASPLLIAEVESGPGIQVCDPVRAGSDDDAAAFATGCARWLHFTVAGNPELGKTPLWTTADYTCKSLGRTNLDVREAEAPRLAQSLGVSHAVLGQVGGRRGRLELTLKLVQLPAGAAVGEPITLDGSEEEVRAGLPGAAREIASRLGVTAPRKPDGPVDGAADLRRIGRLPWYPGEMLPQDQLQALEQMSRRSALAALMWVVNRGVVQDPMLEFAGRGALAKAPGHPLMLAQVARSCNFVSAYGAVAEGAGAIEKGVVSYPRNHLYRVAQTYLLRSRGEFNGARQAAEAAVATSFRNPSAWLLLDATYTAWSESIRQGKTVDALSAEQFEACRKLYGLGLVAAQRATELDPRHLDGWIMLSSTAAFAGDAELADAAFWRAAAAYPEEPAVYRWGLQLYHPKWYEDPAKAARVARRAAEAAAAGGRSWSPAERIEVAAYAYLVGFPEVAEGIVRTADERRTLKEWVEANADQVVPAAQ